MSERKLMTLSGPSLTGKSHLGDMLASMGAVKMVTTTTRKMREGEVDGVHYHFVDKQTFENMIQENALVEHTYFDDNYYGLSKKELEKISENVPGLVVCEVEGVRNIHTYGQSAGFEITRVFVTNPEEILITRFLERFKNDGKADAQKYAGRLRNMMGKEKTEWIEPALSGSAPYEVIIREFTPETTSDVIDLLSSKLGLAKKRSLSI